MCNSIIFTFILNTVGLYESDICTHCYEILVYYFIVLASVNGTMSESLAVIQQDGSSDMSVDVLEMALRMASETGDDSGRGLYFHFD